MLERQHPAIVAPEGSSSSKRSGLLVTVLIRRWFFSTQPACLSNASACSKFVRSNPSPAGSRRLIDGGENLRRQIGLHWRQQGELFGIGRVTRRIFGILKVAAGPAVGAIKQRLVHPLEIKGEGDGFPDWRSLNTGRWILNASHWVSCAEVFGYSSLTYSRG
ncbi:Uncharacterised protein [Raoultella planticola]|uniref:Uncharacterized protein n=1 Tax=Raoultella planticola TaxID=575 RepID=A0A485AGG9_RAOPL|nr:Uncharacterised protein [Raoultella planticola]